jgi:hypothetical protein
LAGVSFRWEYLDARGQTAGRSEPFEERRDAEAWMGEAWEELIERGVQEVALTDDDAGRTVYRMGLGPP